MEKQTTFRIGISMAGAISAGAYTAGVMDYLLEALENWQKAKELGLPGIPKHEIRIEVLSGASAGGMTAIMTAASVQKDFPHIHQQNYFTEAAKENPLYDSWVNLTEDPNSDMMSQMLDSKDIVDSRKLNPKNEVRSLLNSLFIGEVAHRALDSVVKNPKINRSYFAPDMELLTTLTNLRGYNYEMEFITATGTREDRMTMHKDLLHFQLNPSGVYKDDGKIPFHFESSEGLNKNLLIDAAIATGAFPGGLAPRVVVRAPRYINDNSMLAISHGKKNLVDPLVDYPAVCVDGGVINNEPYDLTEIILTNRRKEELRHSSENQSAELFQLSKSSSTFDTTILMIDPFPNYEDQPDANFFNFQALKFTFFQLFGAMRQQLMVKTDLLKQVYDDDDYTRFMIAPIRTRNGVTQKYSIACGSLSGFGGFFSKKFRIHDFMLGRRNCQRFIQQYFCVPIAADNPIIQYGYGDLTRDETAFLMAENHRSLPLIPDIRFNQEHTSIVRPLIEEEFSYPSVRLNYLTELEKKVRSRIGMVMDNLSNSNNPGRYIKTENPVVKQFRKKSWLSRTILNPIGGYATDGFISMGKSVLKKLFAKKFIDAVITDMDKRGLLKL